MSNDLETLRNRLEGLKSLWSQLSRPVAYPLAVASGAVSLYKFIVSTGSLSFPVLGLAVVSLLILLKAPPDSTRLFALRILAFLIDVAFLAVITVSGLFVYNASYGAPPEVIITVVVWLWFLYFVFFDWRFHGTLGKRLFGLKIVSRGKEFSILTSFIRTFLSVILPVVAATWFGSALIGAGSPSRFVAGFWLRETLLWVSPVSILVLGGSQGIADWITRTGVGYEGDKDLGRPTMNLRRGALVCLIPVVCGFALSIAAYVGVGSSMLPGRFSPIRLPDKPNGKALTRTMSWVDPETSGALWTILPMGISKPSAVIQSIRIETLSRNPFRAEDRNILGHPEDSRTLQQIDGLPVLCIGVAPWTSPAAYGLIAKNLAEFQARDVPPGQRRLTVVQFVQLEDYGFFFVKQTQNTLLGVEKNEANVIWGFTDLKPASGIGIPLSLDLGRYALLGDGATRELFIRAGMV